MTKYVYISLVGTSILRNLGNQLEGWRNKYQDISSWHNMRLDDPRNIYPQGLLCRLKDLEPSLFNEMINKTLGMGEKASAEATGIVKMSSLLTHHRRETEVVLYPTSSCSSILSAELNETLLKQLGYGVVRVKVLEKLGRFESFEDGLVELLDEVTSEIDRASSKDTPVYINASPGFKAESSFLVIASLLAGAKGVVYIHETFHEPIFIPAIPISIDEDFVKKVKSLEDRIPLEAWGSIEPDLRRELVDRGIVKHVEGYYAVRPWIRSLIEKLEASKSK
ncbi:MAG: putative CRISPR-associated protein [Thermosphaera sp.]